MRWRRSGAALALPLRSSPEPKAAVESAADVQLAAGGRARRNSVSADEIESFTSAHSDANK